MSHTGALRRQSGHQKINATGVRAVIRDPEGRVPRQRRGDSGTWGLPAGGRELDDNIAAALVREVREVREETGLLVHRAVPFGSYSDPTYSVAYPNGNQAQPFTIAFLIEEWGGTPVGDNDETFGLGFFAFDDLRPRTRSTRPIARPSAMPAPS